ncbi:hypothetical protein RRG08_032041 [Elysia crispata]|uniref:Uncharacterized protein n=1 Tax=Elysia crispata TaxID=231223 RepID=A0AAE1CN64_9GAST|nr:hypothetical protein RRG08_032041 [Elysia crispata]
MVHTKLQRSFDAEELHRILRTSLKSAHGHNDEATSMIHKIDRPPLPRGSTIFEQAKGEMEIERQTTYNGKDTLPLPGLHTTGEHSQHSPHRGGPTPEAMAAMSHLMVPASSPVMGHRRGSRPASRSSARRAVRSCHVIDTVPSVTRINFSPTS